MSPVEMTNANQRQVLPGSRQLIGSALGDGSVPFTATAAQEWVQPLRVQMLRLANCRAISVP
jgi:hypothetical protein